MTSNKKLLVLASALFATEALALNAHRHAHQHAHEKRVVHTNYKTVTEWTTFTYWEGEPTPSKAFVQAQHTSASSSSSSSTSSSTSSSSSSSSISSSTTAAPPPPPPTHHVDVVVPTPTTVAPPPPVPTPAAPSPPPAAAAVAAPAGNGRGLAYNQGELLAPLLASGSKCSWSYNWGQVADGAAPSSLEYVPMMWGPTHLDGWDANAEKAIASGAKNFLSFNECDNAGQCNLGPADAAQQHIQIMNKYAGRVRISTPAITNSGNAGEGVQWLDQFLKACNGQCSYDFCAAHWYNNADTTDFLNHLVQVHETCGKPVWLTEFAPFGSDDQIAAFLKEVLHQLDTNPTYSFVERYAYFMVNQGSLLASPSQLSSYGNVYAFQ